MKTNRLLLVMTFMSLFLLGTSLYGQQDVDPTWYNPWPASTQATAQRPQLAKHKNQPRNRAKIATSSVQRHAGRLRAKQAVVSRRTQS